MVKILKTKEYSVKSPKTNYPSPYIEKDGKKIQNPDLNKSRCSAGIDFFIPDYTEEFISAWKKEGAKIPEFGKFDKDDRGTFLRIAPHSDINIPSGCYTWFDPDIALIGFNKSGVATKSKLQVGACVDDSDYQGILHLHVTNVSDDWQKIYFGEKLVQFVPCVIRVGCEVLDESSVSKDEFFTEKTERGSGGFGSTSLV